MNKSPQTPKPHSLISTDFLKKTDSHKNIKRIVAKKPITTLSSIGHGPETSTSILAPANSPRNNPKVFTLQDVRSLSDTSAFTPTEKYVKDAWPKALLRRDVIDDSYSSNKNKVIVKQEWRLSKADTPVFDKLNEI